MFLISSEWHHHLPSFYSQNLSSTQFLRSLRPPSFSKPPGFHLSNLRSLRKLVSLLPFLLQPVIHSSHSKVLFQKHKLHHITPLFKSFCTFPRHLNKIQMPYHHLPGQARYDLCRLLKTCLPSGMNSLIHSFLYAFSKYLLMFSYVSVTF